MAMMELVGRKVNGAGQRELVENQLEGMAKVDV